MVRWCQRLGSTLEEETMIKKAIPVIALLFILSGCMGMNQTRVSQDQYGNITRTSEPVFHSSPEIIVENENNANVRLEVDVQPDVYVSENSTSSSVSDQPTTNNDDLKLVGFDINTIRTGLILPFTTNFRSPSFNNLKWNKEPDADGAGYEVNVHFSENQRFDLTVGGGAFKSTLKTNSWEQNGIYVNETTRTESYWVHGAVIYKPNSWVYAEGLLGLFYYKLKTDAVTNAAVYTYDGLSGNDIFGAWGVGGGIESPWKSRLHLFAGIRFWLPTARYCDYYAVQVNAGLAYRF
jgi:hypothetical protein